MENIYRIILRSTSYIYFSIKNENLFKIFKVLAQKCLNLSRLQIKHDRSRIDALKELNIPYHVMIIVNEKIASSKQLECDIITYLIQTNLKTGVKNLSIFFSDLKCRFKYFHN
jgi:hypothetical protein